MEPLPQTPTANTVQDPVAAYYNNSQPQISPPQPYQQQRLDHNYGSAPSPEQPAQTLPQQQHSYQAPVAQQYVTPQPQQQPYWQQQQAAPPPQQQNHRAPYQPNITYTQDAFPAAPSHQPQPKQAEEQLIEL